METEPLRIQVASDLHLEFHADRATDDVDDFLLDRLVAPTRATVLALVGDIGAPDKPAYARLLSRAASRYRHVVIVPGNHEYYDASGREERRCVADTAVLLRTLCAAHDNVHLLDDDAVVLEGVRFVGSTLWSHIREPFRRECTSEMNDYRLIHTQSDGTRLTVDDTNAWHAAAVAFIEQETSRAAAEGLPMVVLTHHAPSLRSIDKKHACSRVNCAFATNVERLMRPPIVLWCHGHTHTAFDYVVPFPSSHDGRDQDQKGVRVVNNPSGYPGERDTRYRNDLVIDLPQTMLKDAAARVSAFDGFACDEDAAVDAL